MSKEYDKILERLKERLLQKHKQYGLSYLDRDYDWLRHRLQGELDEMDDELFSPYLSGKNIIAEALDVAIVALLIADKKRRTDEK